MKGALLFGIEVKVQGFQLMYKTLKQSSCTKPMFLRRHLGVQVLKTSGHPCRLARESEKMRERGTEEEKHLLLSQSLHIPAPVVGGMTSSSCRGA
jgi:hypothetical protein